MESIISALQNQVDYEKTLKKETLTSGSNVEVRLNGNISFSINGINFKSAITKPIIHQIGSRIWPNLKNNYNAINNAWTEKYHKNAEELGIEIATGLKGKDSILLLDSKNDKLYGIVSEQFEFISPLEFRNKFIDYYKIYGSPDGDNNKMTKTYFGEVVENFTFNPGNAKIVGEPIKFGVGIIYGLNNGYSSYRIRLNRTILRCTNGLTSVEDGQLVTLKHTKNANVEEFIGNIKRNIFDYDDDFQRQIDKSKKQNNREVALSELFNRLHVGQAVKNRVKERFEIERGVEGDNEWALSQAFTNIATHFYKSGHDQYHESILTEVGSDILDHSLSYVLDLKVKELPLGDLKTYGNLIPRELTKN